MDLENYTEELKDIKAYAGSIYRKLSMSAKAHVDYQDLIQAGMIGLCNAVGRYDGRNDCKFRTYADIRIRGEMIDTVRKFSALPTRIHANVRKDWYYSLKFIPIKEEYEPLAELDTDLIDLHNAIDKLPDGRDKRIINRYLEGHTNVVIGTMEGLSGSMIGIIVKKTVEQIRGEII